MLHQPQLRSRWDFMTLSGECGLGCLPRAVVSRIAGEKGRVNGAAVRPERTRISCLAALTNGIVCGFH